MQTKVKLYNVTLSSLLLSRQVIEIDTDNSNEVKVLNQFFDNALTSTLQELNLDSLTETIKLELLEESTDSKWRYIYKYPSRCARIRKITNCVEMDNRSTHIDKRVKLHKGVRCIFTNQANASIDCIPTDIEMNTLSSYAFLALANNLAFLSAPLITGKGAAKLRGELFQAYTLYLHLAKEIDLDENFQYDDYEVTSEFVQARLS